MGFNPQDLGARVAKHRGQVSIRKTAQEIGIGHATLSRIENGHVPDLDTFAKICEWLGEDPSVFLGITSVEKTSHQASVHLRATGTPDVDTASTLGELIIYARKALLAAEHA